jgi:hypothetical protein
LEEMTTPTAVIGDLEEMVMLPQSHLTEDSQVTIGNLFAVKTIGVGLAQHESPIGLTARHDLCNEDRVVPGPQCRPDMLARSIIMSCWAEAKQARDRSGSGPAWPVGQV